MAQWRYVESKQRFFFACFLTAYIVFHNKRSNMNLQIMKSITELACGHNNKDSARAFNYF